KPGPGRLWTTVLAVAAVYYAAARLGLLLAFEKTNASPVWPPSGIALAAVLLWGVRVWPGILTGALLANVVVFRANLSADAAAVFAVSLCIAAGNTLEALAGALLLRRWHPGANPLESARGVFSLAAAALLACLVSSCIGPTSIALAGLIP